MGTGAAKKGKTKVASRKTQGPSTDAANHDKTTEAAGLGDETRLKHLELVYGRMKEGQNPIYTMDIETDPFKRNKVPVPFLVGVYDGMHFSSFQTDKQSTCLEKAKAYIETLEPGIVYMHNGGRFDFFYMLDWFEGRAMIAGSRVVYAYMPVGNDKKKSRKTQRFEFRDSFAIMPFPLKAYMKDEIDIQLLARENRVAAMGKIVSYLQGDCVYLWELCMGFQNEFGDYKTIASASFAQLTSFHKFEQLPLSQDQELRERFYFGGRVQCFKKGVLDTAVCLYDVNSMYPYVMQNYIHPTGLCVVRDAKVRGWNADGTPNKEKLKTFFLTVEGENIGAFPVREKGGGVDFTQEQGKFHVTIHEYLAALELGRCKNMKVLTAYTFDEYSHFHLFVDHFFQARKRAKESGDKMHELFYKYILNSAYGKFGLNPENYFNWQITKTNEVPAGPLWELDAMTQGKYFVWKQPNQIPWNVKNIATAASITGAARSLLLRAIAESDGVLYCDTDSIICEGFAGGEVDDKKLGAWKLEGMGTRAAIAGKKMYAVFDETGACIKSAHKGVDISPEQILAVAGGGEIFSFRDAPTFKRDGEATFGHRKVRMT